MEGPGQMCILAFIRTYAEEDAHKYTQIPAVGQRTHLYPWGARMHFESCWHGFSSGAQKSSFSSHSSPVDTSTHTSPKHVQNTLLCLCVCVFVCRIPIFTFKEIFTVTWKRSMQAHREPEELHNSGKKFISSHSRPGTFYNLEFAHLWETKKAGERWKSRKG